MTKEVLRKYLKTRKKVIKLAKEIAKNQETLKKLRVASDLMIRDEEWKDVEEGEVFTLDGYAIHVKSLGTPPIVECHPITEL